MTFKQILQEEHEGLIERLYKRAQQASRLRHGVMKTNRQAARLLSRIKLRALEQATLVGSDCVRVQESERMGLKLVRYRGYGLHVPVVIHGHSTPFASKTVA